MTDLDLDALAAEALAAKEWTAGAVYQHAMSAHDTIQRLAQRNLALIAAARSSARFEQFWHDSEAECRAVQERLDAAQAALNQHRCDEQAERAYARAIRAEAERDAAQAALRAIIAASDEYVRDIDAVGAVVDIASAALKED